MSQLTFDEEMPCRVAVVGTSGSGKTWLARRLGMVLDLPHVELDAVHHGRGWTALSSEVMRQQLDVLCPPEGSWIADGNYESKGGDVMRARADVVLWLDLSRRRTMWQVTRRTARRTIRRQELWNGNRESLRAVLSLDPERSILLWAWTQHAPPSAGAWPRSRTNAGSDSRTDPTFGTSSRAGLQHLVAAR